ncbi:DUF1616 domain-containing protein [Candidatus Bathyarchaeota archaeon]|nr:DUF1616 domain-containing protein [Candidatus Bathyarchaeota archaeon]
MNYADFKALYFLSCFTLAIIILSPTLAMVIQLPPGERFSELWILGSSGMAENYPLNVKTEEIYNMSLGVANHMGSLQFFKLCVKFRNQTEPSPNTTTHTPSPIPSLYTYQIFLRDGKYWESPLAIAFSNVSFSENRSTIGHLIINDVAFSIDKSAVWDSKGNGYYYQLFVELWTYDSESKTVQFHNRFVGIWLNITKTS